MNIMLIPRPRRTVADVELAIEVLETKLAYYKLLHATLSNKKIKNKPINADAIPVTTALKVVLRKLKIKYRDVYSDPRKPKDKSITKAVSVKLIGTSLFTDEVKQIVKEMTNLGYIFVYHTPRATTKKRRTPYDIYSGDRFTFTQPKYKIKKTPEEIIENLSACTLEEVKSLNPHPAHKNEHGWFNECVALYYENEEWNYLKHFLTDEDHETT